VDPDAAANARPDATGRRVSATGKAEGPGGVRASAGAKGADRIAAADRKGVATDEVRAGPDRRDEIGASIGHHRLHCLKWR
jgi:hypothetical protein